jgi:hypothetical protein
MPKTLTTRAVINQRVFCAVAHSALAIVKTNIDDNKHTSRPNRSDKAAMMGWETACANKKPIPHQNAMVVPALSSFDMLGRAGAIITESSTETKLQVHNAAKAK